MPETVVVNVRNLLRKDFDTYIGRWNPRFPKEPTYIYANPFKLSKDGTIEEVLAKFETLLRSSSLPLNALPKLVGKRMGCWCVEKPINFIRPNPICHGEIYLKVMNELGLLKVANA